MSTKKKSGFLSGLIQLSNSQLSQIREVSSPTNPAVVIPNYPEPQSRYAGYARQLITGTEFKLLRQTPIVNWIVHQAIAAGTYNSKARVNYATEVFVCTGVYIRSSVNSFTADGEQLVVYDYDTSSNKVEKFRFMLGNGWASDSFIAFDAPLVFTKSSIATQSPTGDQGVDVTKWIYLTLVGFNEQK